MGFEGVPLKQNIGENARKLVKTGPKNWPDFFTHAHIYFCLCIAYPPWSIFAKIFSELMDFIPGRSLTYLRLFIYIYYVYDKSITADLEKSYNTDPVL